MKSPSAKSMIFAAGLCVGMATLGGAIGLSGKHVQAADLPPINFKQPACACTPSELSQGHTLYNCQCGVLQCVVMDNKSQNASSGMVCSK